MMTAFVALALRTRVQNPIINIRSYTPGWVPNFLCWEGDWLKTLGCLLENSNGDVVSTEDMDTSEWDDRFDEDFDSFWGVD
jgi:hypothetical protein